MTLEEKGCNRLLLKSIKNNFGARLNFIANRTFAIRHILKKFSICDD